MTRIFPSRPADRQTLPKRGDFYCPLLLEVDIKNAAEREIPDAADLLDGEPVNQGEDQGGDPAKCDALAALILALIDGLTVQKVCGIEDLPLNGIFDIIFK